MTTLLCACCKKPRSKIKRVDSELINGTQIYLCNPCRLAGHEPRHIVVLAGRSGIDVRDHIIDHKYHGKKLYAEEVTA